MLEALERRRLNIRLEWLGSWEVLELTIELYTTWGLEQRECVGC